MLPSVVEHAQDGNEEPYEDQLADSPAYRSAFFSMMGQTSRQVRPVSSASQSRTSSSTAVASQVTSTVSTSQHTDDQRRRRSQQLGPFAYAGNLQKVKGLLDASADIEFLDDLKQSPLTRAVQGGASRASSARPRCFTHPG